MPHFRNPLPPKPARTRKEIADILESGFRAPNHLGAARDALAYAVYWHAVAMRYREEAAAAGHRFDGTPLERCKMALDIVVLSDEF